MTEALSVLLADDTADIRTLLRMALDRQPDIDVVGEAANGREAIDLASSLRPDVVLLDLAMPVMDGLQAIPEIRRLAPATHIVVLSGFDASAMAEEAIDLGAKAYLQKGESPGRIAELVREVCAREQPVPPPPVREESIAAPITTLGGMADILAVTAHELRTPIAGIYGAADMLQRSRDKLDEEATTKLVDIIVRQSRRLDALVKDVLVVSRLESGQLPVLCTDVSLRSVVANAVDAAAVSGVVVDGSVEGSEAEIVADPERLTQVLVNLLTNADRYGAPPIEIRAEPIRSAVALSVRDHGPGVAADMVDRLFGRYEKGTSARGGVGLGLFIARSLVEAMRGSLHHEPADPGARFVLQLPLAS